MTVKLMPSMMCASYANLLADVRLLEGAGVDYLHVDVMDGHFVPNLTVGPDYVRCLRRITSLPLDVHLMIEEPDKFFEMFGLRAGDRLSFHPEAARHPHRSLMKIKTLGLGAGMALNPATPLSAVEELLPDLDFIQIMSVNPGFAGQPLIPRTLDKVRRLSSRLRELGRDIDLTVDGSVQFDNLLEIVASGATCLVLGPFTCFNPELGIEQSLAKVKELLRG
ncbi:MAG: ribulose-phosphate 3-epimerase [Planctomycetes bacterium]|nr:ribulose-phosphate 3-epimerase [Planctomycetota bacterium]